MYMNVCVCVRARQPSQVIVLIFTVPAQHYSINLEMTSPHRSEEEQAKKAAISSSLYDHFESLVEQVNPEDAASKLYGIAVLDSTEEQQALDETEPVEERARNLMQLLKKKLWVNPGWFTDICKVLRACGVKAIANVIGTCVGPLTM